MIAPKTPPRVTVIVATFNRSDRIEPTLRSIVSQTVKDIEVWVIGDGCTDNTEAVVAGLRDDRIHWFNRTENSGSQGGPNNDGLARAEGRYIAYLGHDDLWLPWHLENLLSLIESSDADLVHDYVAVMDPQGNHTLIGEPPFGLGYDMHFVPPSSWLHTPALGTKVGGWRPAHELSVGVDLDFLLRALNSGASVACCPGLGVVKWPSGHWKGYARDAPYPQKEAWREIETSPLESANGLLNKVAGALASKNGPGVWPSWKGLLHAWSVLKRELRWLIIWPAFVYGRERWPLRELMQRRFRNARRHLRVKRGLA